MEWSVENTLTLIKHYKRHPYLWNCKQQTNRVKRLKNASWNDISKCLCIDRTDVERKIRSLVGQFDREEKKIKESVNNYETKWFAYKHLLFLKGRNKQGGSASYEYLKAITSNTSERNDEDACSIKSESDIRGSIEVKSETETEVPNELINISMRSTAVGVGHNSLYRTPQRPWNNMTATSADGTDVAIDIVRKALDVRVERDEYSVFGENVAFKVRKLSTNYARSTVQHLINNILYEGELGNFDKPPAEIF